MIASDAFVSIFGSVPTGDTEQLVRLVRGAVKAGYAVVLDEPGTKIPVCVLTAQQAKTADRKTQQAAREAGDKAWARRRHPCGVKHALTDPAAAERVVRRVVARYGGANIGIEPGASRMVVVDVDTDAQHEAFLETHGSSDIGMTVLSPGSKIIHADGKIEWAHRDGGHYWFRLPDQVELPLGQGVLTTEAGWSVMWADHQILVPPSARPEGAYQLVGQVHDAPAWLLDLITAEVATRHERAERVRELVSTDIDEWAAATPWAELLAAEEGWIATGLVDRCGCPIWTAPGSHASPKSATAHDLGCDRFTTDAGHAPLHMWTDNPPDFLAGHKTVTKLQYLALRDHEGIDAAALIALGLNTARRDIEFPGFGIEGSLDNFEPDGPASQPDLFSSATEPSDEQHDEPAEMHTPTFLDRFIPADLLDEIEDPCPLVEGMLDLDTVARIVGKSGHGKTFVMLDLACHVATGRPWLGHDVSQGVVVYMAAEGVRGYRKRVRAWEAHHGVQLGKALLTLPEPVQVTSSEAWRELITALVTIKPVLVILDTQARITVGAEENSARDMGIFVERLEQVRRATGACVAVVHHLGHNGEQGRGSSAVLGALGAEILIVKTEPGKLTVTSSKQKDAEEFEPIRVELLKVDTSAVVVADGSNGDPFTSTVSVGPDSNARDRVASLLWAYFEAGHGATKAEIKSVVRERDRGKLGKPMDVSTFHKAWALLEQDGALVLVQVEGVGTRWKLARSEAVRLGLV